MKIKQSLRTGLSFGSTSGIITTLGLIVGLNAESNSKSIIVVGILTIAIADAFSDALGIHISEEAEGVNTVKEIWEATLSTLLSKFLFALSFVIPILLFSLHLAILIVIIWALLVLTLCSHYIAKTQNKRSLPMIAEHLVIAIIVMICTHFAGKIISLFLPK